MLEKNDKVRQKKIGYTRYVFKIVRKLEHVT